MTERQVPMPPISIGDSSPRDYFPRMIEQLV
jgi:hypothetical protein